MAEKSKEEILAEHEARVIACAEATRLYGQNGSAEFGASEMSRAAVLARMCGPGEVVVPREPTGKMIDAAIKTAEHVADRDGEMYPLYDVKEVYAVMLAARPNNGGTDDQGK